MNGRFCYEHVIEVINDLKPDTMHIKAIPYGPDSDLWPCQYYENSGREFYNCDEEAYYHITAKRLHLCLERIIK